MTQFTRRRLLALSATAAVAGCLDSDDPSTETDGPNRTSTTDTATDPPATPPEETPEAGECTVTDLPSPNTPEGVRDPKEYPDPPTDRGDLEAVEAYAREFEEAHRFNSILTDISEDCTQYVEATVDDSSFGAVDGGIVGTVTTIGSYTAGGCEQETATATSTPIHADYPTEEATYYITSEFVLRNGSPIYCG